MVIASYNVNGLRAAMRKGFLDWAASSKADVICLQEVRATPEQIDTGALAEAGWFFEFFPAEKGGYSGTGILSRQRLTGVRRGTGDDSSDREGRVISADIDGVRVYSVYAPSGSSGDQRQSFKMGWLADFAEYCRREMLSDGPGLVFCGDFNICHREEDIHDPKGLSETSGFLPSERDWFTGWLGIGLTDTFRALNPGAVQYSWWSQRSRARQNNKGWRIDYVATCPRVAPRVKRSWIDASPVCSDHCPSLVELSD